MAFQLSASTVHEIHFQRPHFTRGRFFCYTSLKITLKRKELAISEGQIENDFIKKLQELKYTYRNDIRNKAELEQNFRKKFEALNRVTLTDTEFARLLGNIVSNDVFQAAKTLREYHHFEREDGTPLQYTLVNTKDWCKNEFEVINQIRINTEYSHHRYDVVILINGIPVVQLELKRHDVVPQKAMQQIVKYKNDPGNGYTNSLLCFMQLFIVSNGYNTYYFTNNNDKYFEFNADERFLPIYRMAKQDNEKIIGLDDFADSFLRKCKLSEMISRYIVLVEMEQKLMIMRPYQIYAVEAIVSCINENRGNGYIWHTTGSGKTLTSFKASTLLKDNHDIEKCFFVVDRKDLDHQTRAEFNKFQEKCVEENTNTETLVRRMLSEDIADKIIVTTIQKLALALDDSSKKARLHKQKGRQTYKERLKPLSDKRVVFIFDECHRSQFGKNHDAIKTFFPQAQLFGFTGTPIFEENAKDQKIDGTVSYRVTTERVFQKELHAYTITNAIEDKNVLRFHVDYFGQNNDNGTDNKSKQPAKVKPTPEAVVKEILQKHDSATNNRRFNALLATGSINDAINYYQQFKRIQKQKQAENDNFIPLNIACVFTPPIQTLDKDDNNLHDIKQLQDELEQEKEDNKVEPEKKKAALKTIIADYNEQYNAGFSINEFDRYYQDIQGRIKDQQYKNSDYPHKEKIDITIVVDMLLTGFDSKYLNTLYVDKNLKYHGLIQAFSRTNRILNGTKPHGNILDFRRQSKAVDDAIILFSGKEAYANKQIWLVDPASKVIEEYETTVQQLQTFMEKEDLEFNPSEIANLNGDVAKANFINQFREVQKLKTQLDQYTDVDAESKQQIEQLLSEDHLQGFRSAYLEIARELRESRKGGDSDKDDQLDFELVLFSSVLIDYDYIIKLISEITQSSTPQKMNREKLIQLIQSVANLEEDREDIIDYVNQLEAGVVMDEQAVRDGYEKFKEQKSQQMLTKMAQKHGLQTDALQTFVDNIMDRRIFDGEHLSDLIKPMELGWKARMEKETDLMKDLGPYLRKLARGQDISGLSAYE